MFISARDKGLFMQFSLPLELKDSFSDFDELEPSSQYDDVGCEALDDLRGASRILSTIGLLSSGITDDIIEHQI